MPEHRDVTGLAIDRRTLDGGPVLAELITRASTGQHTPLDLLLDRHLVFLHLSGASPRGEVQAEGGRWRRLANSVGRVTVVPAGLAVRGWADYPNPITYLALRLDPGFVEGVAIAAGLPPFRPRAVFGVSDTILRALLGSIAEEVRAGDGLAVTALHGLARAVVARLARRDAGPPEPAIIADGLSPARLRLVRDYVDSRLADPPSVAELAAAAGLSPDYFARRFRQGVGTSPYAFVLERRLDAAVRLLRTTRLPIAEVARATGFTTAAHFSATIRRWRGAVPSGIREIAG